MSSYNDLKANSKRFIFDYSNGKYGYNIDDTFIPFGEGGGSSPISEISYVTYTILATGWTSAGVYGAIETNYPSATYDVYVCPIDTMTDEEYAAANKAMMAGSRTSNVITSLGTVPEVSIPVMLRIEKKAS